MSDRDFSRLIDVSVVMTLSSAFIVISAILLLLDRSTRRKQSHGDDGAFALLGAHVFYLVAAVGLELGKTGAFGLSVSVAVTGTVCGLVCGYIGMRSTLEASPPAWHWLRIGLALAFVQGAIATVTGNVALAFALSSIVNGGLAAFLGQDLYRRAKAARLKPVWLVVSPFALIAAAYFMRLGLIGAGASASLVVTVSIGIGLVFPMATVFWVFASMSLRSMHLTRDIQRSAARDALTGLGNRVALEQLKQQLPSAERRRTSRVSACICVDLDHFKEINDTYGHAAGDAVLVAVATRLAAHAETNGRAFRIGGDEFMLWLEGEEAEEPEVFCQTLLEALSRPVSFGEVDLTVSVSIGYDTTARSGSPWDLIRRADIALYQSKETGRNRVTRYDDRLGAAHAAHLSALAAFRTALDQDQLTAWFQPQIDAVSGALTGCEVLARWHHPERGVLGPDAFIPLARELGILQKVDQKILDIALKASETWERQGTPVPRISLNLSAERLRDPELISGLKARPSGCLEKLAFEVLETVRLDDAPDVIWQLDTMRALGVQIEVDGFGTGNASISAVLALRPERVKIDKRFVAQIEVDPDRWALLRSVVELVRKTNARPVIEGIETEAQLALVRALGPIDAQGFLIARPMEVDRMSHWLASRMPNGIDCNLAEITAPITPPAEP